MGEQKNRDKVLPPWGLDAGTDKLPAYTGGDVARLFSGLFNAGKSPTVPLPGKLNGLEVTVSSGKVTVGEGTCLVGIGQTVGLCGLRAPVSFTVAPKHASFDRLDRVFLLVEYGNQTGRGGTLTYVDGTPGADPAPPPVPDGALDLGIVKVSAVGEASVVSQGQAARLNNVPKRTKTTLSVNTIEARGTITFYRSGNQVTAVIDDLEITFPTWSVDLNLGNDMYASCSLGFLDNPTARIPALFPYEISGNRLRIFGPRGETVQGLRGTTTFIDTRS